MMLALAKEKAPVVVSVGLDIVKTPRIERLVNRFGGRFLKRLLGAEELALYAARKDRIQFLAGRFAAKEAFFKALTGIVKDRPNCREVQVVADSMGRPVYKLSDRVLQSTGEHRVLVSISHDGDTAAAVAVVTAAGSSDSTN
jgi:holo-[acyl-carrier protein] synthase